MLTYPDKKLIHDVNVTDGMRFGGPQGFTRTRIITFWVGQVGPFTVVLDYMNYNAANIDAAFEQEIATLRAAGVVLAQQ